MGKNTSLEMKNTNKNQQKDDNSNPNQLIKKSPSEICDGYSLFLESNLKIIDRLVDITNQVNNLTKTVESNFARITAIESKINAKILCTTNAKEKNPRLNNWNLRDTKRQQNINPGRNGKIYINPGQESKNPKNIESKDFPNVHPNIAESSTDHVSTEIRASFVDQSKCEKRYIEKGKNCSKGSEGSIQGTNPKSIKSQEPRKKSMPNFPKNKRNNVNTDDQAGQAVLPRESTKLVHSQQIDPERRKQQEEGIHPCCCHRRYVPNQSGYSGPTHKHPRSQSFRGRFPRNRAYRGQFRSLHFQDIAHQKDSRVRHESKGNEQLTPPSMVVTSTFEDAGHRVVGSLEQRSSYLNQSQNNKSMHQTTQYQLGKTSSTTEGLVNVDQSQQQQTQDSLIPIRSHPDATPEVENFKNTRSDTVPTETGSVLD